MILDRIEMKGIHDALQETYQFLITIFIIPIFVVYSSKEPIIMVSENEVEIPGLYGKNILLNEIKTISVPCKISL